MQTLLAGGAALSLGAAGKSLAASASTACLALPEENSGPFPADGSDVRHRPGPPPGADRPARGPGPDGPGPDGPGPGGPHKSIPSILTAPGIVREDIRASFDTSATVAAGVPLRLELTLTGASGACQPFADSAVYLWNCNRDGDYSLYGRGIEHENYLRGVQFTDSAGRVAFQTIFPACYSGRYPHLHLEIFKQHARSLDASTRVLTTQLTAPREVCSRVYETAPGYARSIAQFKGLLASDDMVFVSSSPGELALQTLAISGDLSTGFTGRATFGIRA